MAVNFIASAILDTRLNVFISKFFKQFMSRFKGTKEGGINDNASYYVFTQCANGVFEAFPVENWYNFTPVIKYKYLNSDEAEEEYSRSVYENTAGQYMRIQPVSI